MIFSVSYRLYQTIPTTVRQKSSKKKKSTDSRRWARKEGSERYLIHHSVQAIRSCWEKKLQGKAEEKRLLFFQSQAFIEGWALGEASCTGQWGGFYAFFGRSLASVGESSSVSPNPSLFSCHRFVWLWAFFDKVLVKRIWLVTLHLNFY